MGEHTMIATERRPAHGGYPGHVPMAYICGGCGRSNCKLWRRYQTFLSGQRLFCWHCAAKDQDMLIEWVDDHGLRESEFGRTDQIGWLVPAVPAGDTFWGYTSIPQEGVEWWTALPT